MVRKLVRPSLQEVLKQQEEEKQLNLETKAEQKKNERFAAAQASYDDLPPSKTYEEIEYYQQLIKDKVNLIIKLNDNSEVHGYLEYYDKKFLRITCDDEPNRFIWKKEIKYIQEEN
jgi:uncharacterized protein YaaR (DUF327 family)